MKFFVEQLFDGQAMQFNCLITLHEGKVVSIEQGAAGGASAVSAGATHIKGLLAPAYIDVQVNGGGGVLFNNAPSLNTLQTMLSAHAKYGTASMLPTLITDNIDVMTQAADAIAQAISSGVSGVLGVHFEGPYLSVARKGIHPEQHVRGVSDAEMQSYLRKDLGQVCVTLAPENVSCSVIEELVQAGVVVCLGHSNASDEQTFAALAAGATGFTHLFNAMSPLQGRATGVVGAALLDDASFCGLIADNEHVSINSCKLAIKCKTAQRIMLVTDAMAHVGSDEICLPFAGIDITRTGNKLTVANGTLAGSALDMQGAVKNAVELLGCSIEQALCMASSTPAHFLGLQNEKGSIALGQDADWVVLNEHLFVQKLYKNGVLV